MNPLKTLRDLRTYCEANPNNDWEEFFTEGLVLPRPYVFLDSLLDIAYHPCEACDYKYAITYDMTDQGILMMYAYLQTEVDDYIKRYNEWMEANEDPSLYDFENHDRCMKAIGNVKEQWSCEVPLTRGFSDTSKRRDTEFTNLDIDIATREAVEQHEGKHRIHECELRSFLYSSGIVDDLHMEETEVDDLIAAVI